MILARIALLVAMQTGQRFPWPDPGEAIRREIAERRAAEYKVQQFEERWGEMSESFGKFAEEAQGFADELNKKGTWNLPQLLKADQAEGEFEKAWGHLRKAEAWPK